MCARGKFKLTKKAGHMVIQKRGIAMRCPKFVGLNKLRHGCANSGSYGYFFNDF